MGRQEIDPTEWEEYKDKVDKMNTVVAQIDTFLFREGNDGRTGKDDMQLLRVFIHRFSSAKFFLGLVIGIFTVGIPAVYGAIKLIEIIKSMLKG